MQLSITGRNFELTDDVHEYVEKRINKIRTFFDRILETQLVIEVQRHCYTTEIALMASRASFHAQGQNEDIFASIDEAIDKMDKQIRRFKERIRDRRHRMSHREVAVQLSEINEVAEVELEEEPRVVRVYDKLADKPMTVEEAAMQFKLSKEDFLVFLNAETDQINVLYRMRNKNYGWIEPEFV